MDSKYERIEFMELEDINNLEYHKICLKFKLNFIIQRLKRVIPKLKKVLKSKL